MSPATTEPPAVEAVEVEADPGPPPPHVEALTEWPAYPYVEALGVPPPAHEPAAAPPARPWHTPPRWPWAPPPRAASPTNGLG